MGFRIEEVHDLAFECNGKLCSVNEAFTLTVIKPQSRDSYDKTCPVIGVNMKMQLTSHHFIYFENTWDSAFSFFCKDHMLRPDAQHYGA